MLHVQLLCEQMDCGRAAQPQLALPNPKICRMTDEYSQRYNIAMMPPGMDRNLGRIFLPFSQMNKDFLQSVQSTNARTDLQSLITYVETFVSDGDYRIIQDENLSQKALEWMISAKYASPQVKYLDFPFWSISKLATAKSLGLNQAARHTVLDIGAGPGHFGVICKHLGHQHLGLEVPLIPDLPDQAVHLFDQLCDIFRVERFRERIEAGKALQVPGRFSLIVCLMGTFMAYGTEEGRPWNWDNWRFFLNDLAVNHTYPHSLLYFHLSTNYLPEIIRSNLAKIAIRADTVKNVYLISSNNLAALI